MQRDGIKHARVRRLTLIALGCAAAFGAVSLPRLAAAQTFVLRADLSCDYTEAGSVVRVAPFPNATENDVMRGLYYFANFNPQIAKFARELRFGTINNKAGSPSFAVVYRAIDVCADATKHPELKNVPIFTAGNSAEGRYSYGLAMHNPARTLGFCSNVPAGLTPAQPSAAQRAIPGIFFAGEVDPLIQGGINANVAPLMAYARPQGALWAKIEVQGMGHETRRVYHVCYSFLIKMIEKRIPANWNPRQGPVQLTPLVESEGFIADDSTWASGLTKFSSHATFAGDKRGANTSWLPDEYMAYLHRAYSSRNVMLTIEDSEGEFLWNAAIIMSERKPGETFSLTGDAAMYPNWTKIELFDGNKKLQEITGGGATFKFDIPITEASPLSQNFVILAQGPGGPKPAHQFMVLKMGAVVPGTGGTSGSGGTAGGTGGVAGGTGGTAGGEAGAGGDPGTAGVSGEGGVGGEAGGDPLGGEAGSGEGGGGGNMMSGDSGCSCTLGAPRSAEPNGGALALLLGALGWVLQRRRRR